MYKPGRYTFELATDVFDLLQAEPDKYGVADHFKEGREKKLRGETGRIASSVLGGFREDVGVSV